MIATIPFSGFYESLHDSAFDDVVNHTFEDFDDLANTAWRVVNFNQAMHKYAESYAESFLSEFGIAGEFERMQSPREYNFTTDIVFVKIEKSEVQRIFATCDKTELAKVCAESFTSRDGFNSFYDPDFKTWGRVTTWDHNQVGALIKCVTGSDFDQWREYELMEDARGNGYLETWVCESNPEFSRLANIADYLRRRAERV